MTLFFPDVSPFQGAIPLAGAPAVCLKATEGSTWSSGSWFTAAVARAHAAGAFTTAYHFLHAGNAAGQAAWCNARDGGLPLMLDWEPSGSSRPGVGDAAAFIDAYRKAGGTCNLMYLPHWYWDQLGRPSLVPFINRKMALWSSAYTAYSDHGSGWAAYGGMDVAIWQYTSSHQFNGQLVDFNAFKGTLAQLQLLALGRTPPPADPYPTIRLGDAGPAVVTAQKRLNLHGAARPDLAPDGQFGQRTHDAARQFQRVKDLAVDGVVGPGTWARLNMPANPPPPVPPPSPAPPAQHRGEWVSAGQQSLHDLAAQLGWPVPALIRMTAVHYGWFDAELGGYLAGLADGTVPHTARLPAGASLWCG